MKGETPWSVLIVFAILVQGLIWFGPSLAQLAKELQGVQVHVTASPGQ